MPSTLKQLPAEKKEMDEIRKDSQGTTFTLVHSRRTMTRGLFLISFRFFFFALSEWRTVSDPKQAARIFSQELFDRDKNSRSLFLSLDIREDKEVQDQHLVAFYRRNNVKWASPLCCKLYGKKEKKRVTEHERLSVNIWRNVKTEKKTWHTLHCKTLSLKSPERIFYWVSQWATQTWTPRPPSSSLVNLRMQGSPLDIKHVLRQLNCPHRASLEIWRCMMATNWGQDPCSRCSLKYKQEPFYGWENQTNIFILRWCIVFNKFMGSMLKSYQYNNWILRQILHNGPLTTLRSTILATSVIYVFRFPGDVATGSGVDRHMLSCVMLRLIGGFHINSG